MALLNYAQRLDQIKSRYLDNVQASNNGDYVKLIFTQDGHIVTHGVDLLADYAAGKRGLVPMYDSSKGDYAILGKNGWDNLTINYLPVAKSVTANDSAHILTSAQIQKYVSDAIGEGFKSNDAMVFKGGVEKAEDLPSTYEAGYTYRATASFTLNGEVVEIGDLVIAKGDSTSENSGWFVVQTNINGTTKVTINGKEYDIFTRKIEDGFNFYAPSGAGTKGQVLLSTGETPEWVNQSAINAGQLGGKALTELIDSVSAINGKVSVSVGGTSKEATASGNWNINAASANKVNNGLKVTTGLLFTEQGATDFDGSAVRTIALDKATNSQLGGVIVGDNISVADGTISLTDQNIIDALGYKPTAPDDIMEYPIVNTQYDGIAPKLVIPESDANITQGHYMLSFKEGDNEPNWRKLSETAFTNTWRSVKVNNTQILDGSITGNALHFVAGDNITLTGNADGTVQIAAKDTTYEVVTTKAAGLMSSEMLGRLNTITDENYKNKPAIAKITAGEGSVVANLVQDEVTFVGSNITVVAANKQVTFAVDMLSGASASADGKAGLAPAPVKGQQEHFLKGDGSWSMLPSTAYSDTNTWRTITVGSTTLGSDPLNGKGLTIAKGNDNVSVNLTEEGLLTISAVDTLYSAGTGIALGTDNKFNLKSASTTEIGGIKVSSVNASAVSINAVSNMSGRNYGVEIDKNGNAYVNVPWEDTNIRDIQVNGESIGTATLNIIPSEEIHLIKDKSDTGNVYEVGFGLSWYNISEDVYEYANEK